jgi:flagellar hook-associated protein FlgK
VSDLLSLASTGISAYQRALSTVSNNIANVGTDGYTRQEVGLASNQPRQMGNSFIGTGVRLEAVRRQYDAFIEANLRNASSNLEAQGPLVEYANRVMDLMANPSTGLSGSLTAFFAAARDLAVEPASVIARSSFLRQADGAASGFRQLNMQLGLIDDETRQGLGSTIDKINTYAEQIALVNKQLFKNGSLDPSPRRSWTSATACCASCRPWSASRPSSRRTDRSRSASTTPWTTNPVTRWVPSWSTATPPPAWASAWTALAARLSV